jgi:hypothetical protein
MYFQFSYSTLNNKTGNLFAKIQKRVSCVYVCAALKNYIQILINFLAGRMRTVRHPLPVKIYCLVSLLCERLHKTHNMYGQKAGDNGVHH